MINKFWILALTILQIGCTVNPIPDNYEGPLSYINDSVKVHSEQKADFFFLDKVNGEGIRTSVMKTISANDGRGFLMTPVVIGRAVPAEPAVFTITGRTHYAAPILALTNTVYEVSGDIEFAPKPDANYVVKGVLKEHQSQVWIEEEITGKIVAKKITSPDAPKE